ncbi:hypothetical protein LA03_05985 [Burkholderia gladioli]|uniref:hypothetical protein n=1 Tax=Burkholderia gladioli TaxID=28095 RepID=UPI00051041A3|nr:hypothetical protein [Burkholderia gladioli]KGE11117.1 hypothetical protein LA03_05985 [Burkholderia gladioli]
MTQQSGSDVHEVVILADFLKFQEWGIYLTSGELVGDIPTRQTRFRTDLKEPARYLQVPPGSIALGRFGEHDLQLGIAGSGSAALLARYGKDDGALHTRASDSSKPLEKEHEAIREAYRRARALGWGDLLTSV